MCACTIIRYIRLSHYNTIYYIVKYLPMTHYTSDWDVKSHAPIL